MPSVPLEIGEIITVDVTPPAAQANFLYLLPHHFMYKLLAISWRITADANVANRYPGVVVTEVGGQRREFHAVTAITASQVVDVDFNAGLGIPAAFVANSHYTCSLPDSFYLYANTTINSDMLQMQVTDQLTDCQIVLARWPQRSI